jgi:hypothetical protein
LIIGRIDLDHGKLPPREHNVFVKRIREEILLKKLTKRERIR